MKKKLIIFLLFFTIILTACDASIPRFGECIETEEIKTIELINYINSEQHRFISWIPDHSSDLKNLNVENIEVIETLSDESISSFEDELFASFILLKYYTYDSPSGLCVRLILNSEDYILLNTGYIGKYDSKGIVISFYGCFDGSAYFSNLLKYSSKNDV